MVWRSDREERERESVCWDFMVDNEQVVERGSLVIFYVGFGFDSFEFWVEAVRGSSCVGEINKIMEEKIRGRWGVEEMHGVI